MRLYKIGAGSSLWGSSFVPGSVMLSSVVGGTPPHAIK